LTGAVTVTVFESISLPRKCTKCGSSTCHNAIAYNTYLLFKVEENKRSKTIFKIDPAPARAWTMQKCLGNGPVTKRRLSEKLTMKAVMAVQQREVNSLLTKVRFWSEPKRSNQMAPYQTSRLTAWSRFYEAVSAEIYGTAFQMYVSFGNWIFMDILCLRI
jgi:hypothetical protein